MTVKLSWKSGMVFTAVLMMLVAGIAYAATTVSRGVQGFVSVTADVTVDDVLTLYEDVDGHTGGALTSIDFGTVDLDPFGNPTRETRVTVWVMNGGGTTYRLTIDDQETGPGTGDTFAAGEVLFAGSGDALSAAPEPDIILAPDDLIAVDVGLDFSDVVSGDHVFTVSFRAEEFVGVPTPDGIVAWWPFDEGTGGIAHDIWGINDGILNGPTWTTGMVEGALSFDGSGDYVAMPNSPSLNPTGEISVEVWFKPVSFRGVGNNAIVDKGYVSHTDPFYQHHLGACPRNNVLNDIRH